VFSIVDTIYCQGIAADRWFSPGTSNKTDHHDITEILLKVALNTIALFLTYKIHNIATAEDLFIFDYHKLSK
jgi:hypothetical protein